jgi:hypothetical protein
LEQAEKLLMRHSSYNHLEPHFPNVDLPIFKASGSFQNRLQQRAAGFGLARCSTPAEDASNALPKNRQKMVINRLIP